MVIGQKDLGQHCHLFSLQTTPILSQFWIWPHQKSSQICIMVKLSLFNSNKRLPHHQKNKASLRKCWHQISMCEQTKENRSHKSLPLEKWRVIPTKPLLNCSHTIPISAIIVCAAIYITVSYACSQIFPSPKFANNARALGSELINFGSHVLSFYLPRAGCANTTQ